MTSPSVIGIGLSPRVRGNQLHDLTLGYRNRSIPACAGEPHRALSLPAIEEVYPRVCGGTIEDVEVVRG